MGRSSIIKSCAKHWRLCTSASSKPGLFLRHRSGVPIQTDKSYSQHITNVLAVLVLVIILSLAGCATVKLYPGPHLPQDKVGILNLCWGFDHYAVLTAVDGEKPPGNYYEKYSAYGSYALLPGNHTITIDYVDQIGGTKWVLHGASGVNTTIATPYGLSSRGEQSLPFTVVAGHSYKLRCEFQKLKWKSIEVMDTTTQTVIFHRDIPE